MKKIMMITALFISAAMLTACANKGASENGGSDGATSSDSLSGVVQTTEQSSKPTGADTSDSAEAGFYGVTATGLDGIEVAEEELSNICRGRGCVLRTGFRCRGRFHLPCRTYGDMP